MERIATRAIEIVMNSFFLFVRKFCIGSLVVVATMSLGVDHLAAQDDANATSPTVWISAQGKKIEATFVRMNEDSVVLQLNSTGKEASVPLSSLSLESHLQALKLADPSAFSKPLVKADALPEAEPFEPTVISSSEMLVSPFGSNPSIESFLDTLNNELERGNVFVFWHTLPPRMQTDLDTIMTKTLGSVTPPQMNQIRMLFASVQTLVVDKKNFIFGYPQLASQKEAVAQLAQEWPVFEDLAKRVCAEDNWQATNFQAGKTVPWLAQMCSHLSPMISKGMAEQSQMFGKIISYRILSQSADSAEVELKLASAPMPLKVRFQKFENIWIVPEWMNQMRQGLDQALPQVANGIDTAPLGIGLLTANSVVRSLAQAETQEDFNTAVEEIMELPGIKEAMAQVMSQMQQQAGGMQGMQGGGTPPGDFMPGPGTGEGADQPFGPGPAGTGSSKSGLGEGFGDEGSGGLARP